MKTEPRAAPTLAIRHATTHVHFQATGIDKETSETYSTWKCRTCVDLGCHTDGYYFEPDANIVTRLTYLHDQSNRLNPP